MKAKLLAAAALASLAVAPAPAHEGAPACAIEIVVLGAGQDAGAPQIGNAADDGPVLLPSSLGVIDRAADMHYLFDASPAITAQLAELDRVAGRTGGLKLDAVFLTHAHVGHYLGLAYLGREAAGAGGVPVFAMPRMAAFLRENGPWGQLVTLGNIDIHEMAEDSVSVLTDEFGVFPIIVPHRDEYSETVGFVLMTPEKRALYVPDLDNWDEFAEASGTDLADLISGVDLAFVDATFWDDNELDGRDMSAIPHPRVLGTMERLAGLPASERAKLRFIHYNHTNPIRDPGSEESAEVAKRGFGVARRGDRHCLVPGE